MRRRSTSSSHGFTLIEMMVVLSIIGVIAAVSIPNLRGALQKKNLLQAQLEMNNVVTGWIDTVGQGLPPFYPTGTILNLPTNFPVELTAAELETILQQPVPETDPWGNSYRYLTDDGWNCIAIISANRDGLIDDDVEVGKVVEVNDLSTDLVLVDRWWLIFMLRQIPIKPTLQG